MNYFVPEIQGNWQCKFSSDSRPAALGTNTGESNNSAASEGCKDNISSFSVCKSGLPTTEGYGRFGEKVEEVYQNAA